MLETIQRNMLKYQVGHKMFCRCNQALDIRDAVSVDVLAKGELRATAVYCGKCADELMPNFQRMADAKGLTIEVTDGRKLNGKGKQKEVRHA